MCHFHDRTGKSRRRTCPLRVELGPRGREGIARCREAACASRVQRHLTAPRRANSGRCACACVRVRGCVMCMRMCMCVRASMWCVFACMCTRMYMCVCACTRVGERARHRDARRRWVTRTRATSRACWAAGGPDPAAGGRRRGQGTGTGDTGRGRGRDGGRRTQSVLPAKSPTAAERDRARSAHSPPVQGLLRAERGGSDQLRRRNGQARGPTPQSLRSSPPPPREAGEHALRSITSDLSTHAAAPFVDAGTASTVLP